MEARKEGQLSCTGVTDYSELPCGCCELNLDLLEEQRVLLPAVSTSLSKRRRKQQEATGVDQHRASLPLPCLSSSVLTHPHLDSHDMER